MSLIPEPKYNPRWPKNETLASTALDLMLGGATLCHPSFFAYTGSWRLAAHIHILRRLGWPIEKEEIEYDVEKDLNEKHMVKYSLSNEIRDIIQGNV